MEAVAEQDNNQNPAKNWKLLIGLLTGLVIGWHGHKLTANYAGQVEVLYLSQDELLALEQERLEGIKDALERKLFNDNSMRVLDAIEALAKTREGRSAKVVFSRGPVSGENVRSITAEIYQELLPLIMGEVQTVTGSEVIKRGK